MCCLYPLPVFWVETRKVIRQITRDAEVQYISHTLFPIHSTLKGIFMHVFTLQNYTRWVVHFIEVSFDIMFYFQRCFHSTFTVMRKLLPNLVDAGVLMIFITYTLSLPDNLTHTYKLTGGTYIASEGICKGYQLIRGSTHHKQIICIVCYQNAMCYNSSLRSIFSSSTSKIRVASAV